MDKASYYLAQNIQIEPLVNQWHAHPHLISPATYSMYIQNSHLSIMRSYVQMPMAHAKALENPDLIGGPFIDYKGKRVDEVRKLMQDTKAEAQDLFALSEGIKQLDALLKMKAKGHPFQELYKEIPGVLKGYVELVYDLNNNPSFRFIENLLYKSKFYNECYQSFSLSQVNSDIRPFIFSTPRLSASSAIQFNIPFNSSKAKYLTRLKSVPAPFDEIVDTLEVTAADLDFFKSFLTTIKPKNLPTYNEKDVRVRYFGHACVLFETDEVSILVDPLISYKYDTPLERYTFEDLPDEIDYVLITHGHHDHIVLETLLQIREKIKTVVVPRNGVGFLEDPSLKKLLNALGFKHVIEIDELDGISIPSGEIIAIPFYGEHCDLNIRTKTSYCLELKGRKFITFADSNAMDGCVYDAVQRTTGNVDAIFIGLECEGAPMSWAYGPLFCTPVDNQLDKIRRSNGSNSENALKMIDIFKCKNVFLYAMGLEPWLNYIMALQHGHTEESTLEASKLMSACQERNVTVEKLYAKKTIIFN